MQSVGNTTPNRCGRSMQPMYPFLGYRQRTKYTNTQPRKMFRISTLARKSVDNRTAEGYFGVSSRGQKHHRPLCEEINPRRRWQPGRCYYGTCILALLPRDNASTPAAMRSATIPK
ncbi:hypothetical protein PHLCEN_2v933 [Hermanssonia centrifuga]|uniref:Uncharacterized protein n=1 Tax=Hermanssonia centrifuga TaxID=98765 RepID=A0A2R6S4N0_9APHY|nr:hypothetical protein PHLCEN_2v933 [Hermanssonia centrifuga]